MRFDKYPGMPNYSNCEGGGDCSKDFSNWTKEHCKWYGLFKCDCKIGQAITLPDLK